MSVDAHVAAKAVLVLFHCTPLLFLLLFFLLHFCPIGCGVHWTQWYDLLLDDEYLTGVPLTLTGSSDWHACGDLPL